MSLGSQRSHAFDSSYCMISTYPATRMADGRWAGGAEAEGPLHRLDMTQYLLAPYLSRVLGPSCLKVTALF